MAIDYSGFTFGKPEKRITTKRRQERIQGKAKKDIRAYVFEREQSIYRCCRVRPATSMHELRFRSLGGKVSKTNSIAVCGSGVSGCHGLLQSLAVDWQGDERRAEGVLEFKPRTHAAADYMRVRIHQWVQSGPTPQIRGEVEC